MEKHCSRCKQEFTCGCEARGCWCESVKVEKKELEALKTEFDNCLCPGCLAEYAVKQEKN